MILIFILICLIVCLLNVNPYKTMSFKYDRLNIIDSSYVPQTELYEYKKKIYNYPFILKPNRCTKLGHGVSLIKDRKEELKYISTHGLNDIIIQTFIPYENEVGILYERNPLLKNGSIISIFKGRKLGGETVNQEGCSGNYKNRNDLITKKLTKVIDTISKSIPDFYVGRFDVRYKTDELLKEGKEFFILEVNGVFGLDGHFFRSEMCKPIHYFRFIYAIRWFCIRVLYGLLNLIRLNGIPMKNYIMYIEEALRCRDFTFLIEPFVDKN